MKLLQLLQETSENSALTEDDKLAMKKALRADCQQWFNLVGDSAKKIVRGMDNRQNDAMAAPLNLTQRSKDLALVATVAARDLQTQVWIHAVRNNRRPLSSAGWLHDAMNASMRKRTGIDIRSAAVFATASTHQALDYGSVYRICPIGEFAYVWSPMIGDPTLMFDAAGQHSRDFIWKQPANDGVGKLFFKDFAKKLDSSGTFESDKGAIVSLIKQEYPESVTGRKLTITANSPLEEILHEVHLLLAEFKHNAANDFYENAAITKYISLFIEDNPDLWKYNKGFKEFLEHPAASEIMITCDRYYSIPASYLWLLS